MKKKVIVVGAGINGLVAANYLKRGGADVLLLEKKDAVGGACTMEWREYPDGKTYPIPTGASVFGMMQDFVYTETGLRDRLQIYRSSFPKMVYFGDEPEPFYVKETGAEYVEEMRTKWGERGKVQQFRDESDQVRDYLLSLYRKAESPNWDSAVAALGTEVAEKYISGSAKALLDEYFTADRSKIYEAMAVNESGPVDFRAPFTSFNLAAMSAGSVFDGYWGFVKGALWKLPLALADINRELGVEILTKTEIVRLDPKRREVIFRHDGKERTENADAIFLATDPMTAAKLTDDSKLIGEISEKRYRGSSGKVVFVFNEKARWKGNPGHPEFDASVRYLYEPQTWDAFEASNAAVREGRVPFSPCSFQVYVEGGAMRQMGWDEPYDYMSIFCKDWAFGARGDELEDAKKEVERRILARLENPESFVGSVLFTPKNLQENFFFPEGNIDHMQLCDGQNFFARTFSAQPEKAFYQLGNFNGVFYCGAGGFPCGSVAGTPGMIAARQWMKTAL